jgi:phage gp36-like protein
MTRYADISDFGLAGVDATIIATIDNSEALRHLDMASSLADSYLGRRINTPLLVWGDDLRQCVCRLAAYDLASINVGLPVAADPSKDLFKINYDLAIKWLEGVAEGKITPSWIANGTQGTSNASRIAPHVLTKPQRGWGRLL